jgi:hypothetical protein
MSVNFFNYRYRYYTHVNLKRAGVPVGGVYLFVIAPTVLRYTNA